MLFIYSFKCCKEKYFSTYISNVTLLKHVKLYRGDIKVTTNLIIALLKATSEGTKLNVHSYLYTCTPWANVNVTMLFFAVSLTFHDAAYLTKSYVFSLCLAPSFGATRARFTRFFAAHPGLINLQLTFRRESAKVSCGKSDR